MAEGVETVESYNTLAQLGCDYAQGYFLSTPLSPDKMSLWLEAFTGSSDEHALDQWAITAPSPEPVVEPAVDPVHVDETEDLEPEDFEPEPAA